MEMPVMEMPGWETFVVAKYGGVRIRLLSTPGRKPKGFRRCWMPEHYEETMQTQEPPRPAGMPENWKWCGDRFRKTDGRAENCWIESKKRGSV